MLRRVFESGTKARKWLLGLVLAGVAAAITSYVTGGITSGVDRVKGSFEEDPAPLAVTVTHSAKNGSGHWVLARSDQARSRRFHFPRVTSESSTSGTHGHDGTGAWTEA